MMVHLSSTNLDRVETLSLMCQEQSRGLERKTKLTLMRSGTLSATLTSHERCRKGGARQASNIILATGGLKVACPCHQTVGSASDHQCPNLVPRTGSRRCRATIRRRSATSGDWYDDTDAKPQTCRVWPHARSSAVRPGGLRPQTAGGDTSLIDWLSKPIEALLS